MSFDDFINRPKYEIEAIVRVINEVDNKRNTINNSILEDLEKSTPNFSDK